MNSCFFEIIPTHKEIKRLIFLLNLLVVLLFVPINIFSQHNKIDSIKTLLSTDIEDTTKVDLYIQLAYYSFKEKPDSTDYYLKKACALSNSIDYHKGITRSLEKKGIFAERRGHYDLAVRYYLELLEKSNNAHDSAGILQAYFLLSYVNFNASHIEKSLEYSRKALSISKKLNNIKIWNIYNTIGLAYRSKNQNDSAIYYFKKSKQFAIKQKNKYGIIYSTGNMTSILLKNKEYEKALKNFQEVLELAEEINNYPSVAVSYSGKSISYLELAKLSTNKKKANELINLAIESGKKSLLYSEKIQSLTHVNNAYQRLFFAYKQQKEYKKSSFYAEKSMRAQDSLYNIKRKDAIKDLENKYKINIMQKEKKYQERIIKKQKLILALFSSASIIIAILLVMLYIFYRNQKRTNSILYTQNIDIESKKQEITTQRNKLYKLNSALETANKTKDQFFSILAHDLKNPFNSILGFSELIKNHIENKNYDDVLKFAKILHKTGNKTYELLENLLNWAKFQRNMITYKPQLLNAYDIIDKTIEHLEQAIIAKEIKLTNDINKNLYIYSDEFMISTIIRNITYNAVKFTNRKGEINISAETINDDTTNIMISDTGVGMTDENVKNLFKLGIESQLGTENEKGTGLGLIISKEFAQKNGGDLWVKSQVGVGSTFYVSISTKQT